MRRVLIAALLSAGPAAAQTVTVVAASSTTTVTVAAPGGGSYAVTTAATPQNQRAFGLDSPILNASGQVAFTARLAGGAGTSGLFLTAADGAAAASLARQGAAAPGGLGTFGNFTNNGVPLGHTQMGMNAAGQVALQHTATGGGAVLRFQAGSAPTVIAAVGQAAPSGGTYTYQSNSLLAVNASGQVSFGGGTATADGQYRGNGTTAVTISLVGAPAPGGGTLEGFGAPGRVMATDGAIAFSGYLDADSEVEALFVAGGAAAPAQIARLGAAAPAALGGSYDSFTLRDGAPALNSAGQAAFKATTAEGASAVLRWTAGATQVLARDGTAAPGTGGGTFDSFGPVNRISGSGRVAFLGEVSGGNVNRGIFTADGTTVTAVVVGGQAAPGLPGVTFGTAANSSGNLPEEAVRINDAGGVAFWARLTGSGVTAANDSSLWYDDGAGNLALMLREGQAVTVGPGDVRTLAQLPDSFELSDAGLVLLATFTDGSDAVIYVAIVPIPEPAAAVGLAAAGLLAVRRLRRPC
jgi:hypothetical protein